MSDILTVAWKEWRELIWLSSTVRGGRIGLLVILGMFGVFLPFETGAAWVTSVGPMLYWAWLPLMLVSGAVADSFAGERERHTLETLLASRLPDRAILFGKVLAAISYGWLIVMAILVLSFITVNLSVSGSGLLLPPWRLGLAGPLVALLGSGLAASAGVLVSLRAATVRQAAQTLNVAVLIVVFAPVLGAQAMPESWRAQFGLWMMSVGIDGVVWTAVTVLAGVDVLILAVAAHRFQRSRLMLD